MKYALITGAGNGLGLKATKTLSENGFFVFACDIFMDNLKTPNPEQAMKNVFPIYMDVTSNDDIIAAYKTIIGMTQKLDVILNFAGIGLMDSLIEGNVARVEKILEINVIGTVKTNKAFFPLIQNGKGRIINIGSETGWTTASPFNGAYSMSKYAIRAYTDSLRRELNLIDIKVIEIMPGSFQSNMHTNVRTNFEELRSSSKLYSNVLMKMGAMMEKELNAANDYKYLEKAILHAATSNDPKIRYKVKNSFKLVLMTMLPDVIVDAIYLGSLK